MTENNPDKAARCISVIYTAVEELSKEGMPDWSIASALTLIAQGFGITPEQYADSFDAGRVIYDDFKQYVDSDVHDTSDNTPVP